MKFYMNKNWLNVHFVQLCESNRDNRYSRRTMHQYYFLHPIASGYKNKPIYWQLPGIVKVILQNYFLLHEILPYNINLLLGESFDTSIIIWSRQIFNPILNFLLYHRVLFYLWHPIDADSITPAKIPLLHPAVNEFYRIDNVVKLL
jgi:hypothetical protein